jgi:hypothetical protein
MGGKHAPTTDAAPSLSALPTAMNQGKGPNKEDPYYSPKCRLRRSDPSADQLIQFVRGNQGLQRESTEMRLLRRAPLPGIGQSLTPRSNVLNPTNPINSVVTAPQQPNHRDQNEFNNYRFSKDDNLERVGISSDDSDSDCDLSVTYGTRMMRATSPPRSTITLNPVGLKLSNSTSYLVPKKQTVKPQRKNKQPMYKLNAKNKRFESVQRRATADVRYLPPIRRGDIPDRPSAPRPNRTPPLVDSDDDYYGSTIAEEPIDYIDQD